MLANGFAPPLPSAELGDGSRAFPAHECDGHDDNATMRSRMRIAPGLGGLSCPLKAKGNS